MKILVLYSRIPYPLTHGGNLRVFHYARHLQRNHSLDLYCYGEGNTPEEVSNLFDTIVHHERPSTPGTHRFWRNLGKSLSINHMFFLSPELQRDIKRAVSSGKYDLIWLGGNDMQILLPEDTPTPILLDDCDFDLLAIQGLLRTSQSISSFIKLLKLKFMTKRFNKRYHPRANAAIYVSQADADAFRLECPSVPVHVLENGVDTEYFKSNGEEKRELRLVFEGNMGFKPNIDAAEYFCEQILPSIEDNLGQPVNLTIVGKDPAPEVQRLASKNVEITGFVDDIRPFMEKASVFVCPMRIGTGIKNKILQAWSMSLPVVATDKSIGGLIAENGKNIMVASGTTDFAAKTTQLLQNSELRLQIGLAGRETVLKHYSWEQKAAQLEEIMESLSRKARHVQIST